MPPTLTHQPMFLTDPRHKEGTAWFHDLLHRDGSPYDADEAEMIRRVTG